MEATIKNGSSTFFYWAECSETLAMSILGKFIQIANSILFIWEWCFKKTYLNTIKKVVKKFNYT